MARYKITLTQTSWTGGTAAFWFDPDVGDAGTAYDAETGGNAITSITVPTRDAYTFLGFGLTNPYWRCVSETGEIFAAKCKELFNTASTAVNGSLAAKTLPIFQAQTSTISPGTATVRTITITSTYWKGAPSKLYYNPGADRFYLDQAQTEELSGAVTAGRECWTYSGCWAGTGPQYVSSTPAKSGDQYIDAAGAILDELRIRAKVQTTLTINPRGVYYSYKISLDANGGTIGDGGISAIYRPIDATGTYYTTYLCESGTEITALSAAQLPGLSSKIFGGFTIPKVTAASGAATATYYADAAGTLNIANLDALSLSPTGSVSLVSVTTSARWVGVCTVTVNKGTNGTNAALPLATFYADTVNGRFYSDSALQSEITNIGVPTNECYRFTGCYNAAAGATQYVDDTGDITAALVIAEYTTTLTIYCQWAQTSWRLTFNKVNGSGGTAAIYRSVTTGDWYADPLAEYGDTSPITALTPPSRDGYVFLGYFKTTSATSEQLVARDGTLNLANLATLTPSGTTPPSATGNAVWQQLRTVNIGLNATNATVGAMHAATAASGDNPIFYGIEDAAYYADSDAEVEVGVVSRPVALPTVRCSTCTGIWSAASSGDQKFDDGGLLVSGATAPTSTITTWYAQWTRKSYVAVLDDNGGSGGSGAIFSDGETSAFYSDDDLTAEISAVTPPTRDGYTFIGYYSSRTGGTIVVDATGNIVVATGFGARDLTVYALWQANRYSLTFSGGGILTPKTVTFGQAIGTLPTPVPGSVPHGARFQNWLIDGLPISSSTIWTWASDKTATVEWQYAFGDVTDYFGLASPTLVPFESDDGTSKPHIVTRHYGKGEGADATGPTWRNPVVKYMVVGSTTLNVALGRAYAGSDTETGYMITSATVETALGRFPVVTVAAVANEGANAINTFSVSVTIQARARAQNLLWGMSGGGALHALTLAAICDPVVVQENMAPCASDVVNGRYELHAETLATNFDAAPSAANGFTGLGSPVAKSGTYYTRYQLSARREIL